VIVDPIKAALLIFVAVLVQVSMLSAYSPLRGRADVVLVAVLSLALLRGSLFGAIGGFSAGLLLDTANLGTLGFTSLLLTLAGYWIGRYGETTARDRFHAPFISVLVVTILYAFGSIALRVVLGEAAPAREILAALPATLLLNLIFTWPVYTLARRLFPPAEISDRIHEVRLLG
jgi:rod shape-determining protein MreD